MFTGASDASSHEGFSGYESSLFFNARVSTEMGGDEFPRNNIDSPSLISQHEG